MKISVITLSWDNLDYTKAFVKSIRQNTSLPYELIIIDNGSETETSVDPVTGTVAFEGYRIYRSTDNGISWGTVINNFDGSPTEVYKPLAIYDLENEYSGPFAMSDPLLYYDMGSNSGLKYSYVDESVINGYEYYYSVSAYDHPDTWSGAPVDPLENPKQKDAQNTVKVVPEPYGGILRFDIS